MEYIFFAVLVIILAVYIFIQRSRELKKKYENMSDEDITKTAGRSIRND